MKFVLFDIDGTLLDSGEAGTRSLNLAFEEVFSITKAFSGISMAGKTDVQIMKEVLLKHGLSSNNGIIPLLCDSYLRHLKNEINNPRKHLKAGIGEALSLLSRRDDVFLGLLTGNIEAGARIKLGSFGLNKFFPLGAFGDDHEDRNMLLPIAVRKFKELYAKGVDFRDCIVIGDTPRDVECAKIYGAYAIAVATGPYSYESLAGSGADIVLENMQNTEYVFNNLLA